MAGAVARPLRPIGKTLPNRPRRIRARRAISALSEVPEAIVVCERTTGGTTLRRLESEKLAKWLDRYRLGELWRMGEIGGTRW